MEETNKTYVTREEVSRVCESFIAMDDIMKHPRDKIKDLYFYGYYGPIPLTHNHIRVNKEGSQYVEATQDIPAQVVVTHYPVHAIGLEHRVQFCEGEMGDEAFYERVERYAKTHSYYLSLRQDNDDEKIPVAVLLIGNPGNTRNPLLLGHIIRDAVGNPFEGISFKDIRQWITFKNRVVMYYISCSKKQNCRFVGNSNHTLLSIESTRPIKEGEELLISRGAEYWFHKQYDKEDKSMLGNYLFEMLADDKDFTAWLAKLHK